MAVISMEMPDEILGIFKMDLITLYGKMGLSYIEMSEDEIEEELETVNLVEVLQSVTGLDEGEIKLFSIKDTVAERTSSEVTLEKELQRLIEQNMEIFFGVRFLESEYSITNGRMVETFT